MSHVNLEVQVVQDLFGTYYFLLLVEPIDGQDRRTLSLFWLAYLVVLAPRVI